MVHGPVTLSSQIRRTLRANGAFRTKYIDPTFHDNLLKIKEKGLIFNEQPFRKSDINPISTQKQIRTATPLPAPPPQDGASTNFATWVYTVKSFPHLNMVFTIPIAIGIATWVCAANII